MSTFVVASLGPGVRRDDGRLGYRSGDEAYEILPSTRNFSFAGRTHLFSAIPANLFKLRHPDESRGLGFPHLHWLKAWVPAFAGMTEGWGIRRVTKLMKFYHPHETSVSRGERTSFSVIPTNHFKLRHPHETSVSRGVRLLFPSPRRKSGPRLSAFALVASLGPGVRRDDGRLGYRSGDEA